MKKKMNFGILFSTFAVSLGLASCTKDWKCDCKYNGNSATVAVFPHTKRADAKKACDAYGKASGLSCSVK